MFKALSILICLSLVMSTAGEGIHAIATATHAYGKAVLQGEPDAFNEAPPSPVAPYQNGRDESRAGMWNTTSLQQLATGEQSVNTGLAQPSGLPAIAPQNVLMQPMMEEAEAERISEVESLPVNAVASVAPQVPVGNPNGGLPLPWESGFPGGGSSGVETVVNSNTGNLNLRVPIMNWKIRGGMEVDFSLYYNSRTNLGSRFGKNWSSSFDAYIWKFEGDPGYNKLFVRWGDGTVVKFDQTAPGSYTYKSPAGLYETITESFPVADTYTLKTKSGMQYVFQKFPNHTEWFLTKIRERITANEILIQRNATNPYTFEKVSQPGVGDRLSVGAAGDGGKITTINDFTIGGNRTWTIGYGTNGMLSSIKHPQSDGNGPTRSFTYNTLEGNHFLASETDLRGKTWLWQLSSTGMCLAYWTPTTNKTFFDLNPAYYFQYTGDSCTWVKPGRSDYGNFTRTSEKHQYNYGRIANVYDEAGFYDSYTWVVGDLSVYIDKRQKFWSYVYDANGNVTQTTTPTGEIQKYTYNGDNDLESTYSDQVPNSVHRFAYSYGRCVSVSRRVNPIGLDNVQATASIYTSGHSVGQYSTITPYGPGGGTPWTLTYNPDQRYSQFLIEVKDSQNNTTNVSTDEWGRILTVTPPNQSATTISYDNRMRPYKVTHPGGDYVEVTYDGEDNVTSLRDELGRYSYWTYDDDGRLTSYQNAKSETETYVYDDQGFMKQVINARGYARSYVPNLRNEVYRLTHADGQKEYWSYYATGETASYTDGFGTVDQATIAYGFDSSGRPTGVTYPYGSGTPDVTITYSNYGRTVTMVDGSGTSKWNHDGFDRLTRFEQPGWNIDYGYQNFHDTPVSMTDPSGTTSYQYDNRGNLWKLTNPVNEVTEWLYDPAGRLSQRKLGNGTWEEVGYDSRSRVTGIALKKPGATLRQHTYGYNAVSNVTSHSVAGVTTSYGYDLADQLTSESRPGYAASYTYDANGNRATRTVNGVTETYVNDVADKLTSISVGGNTVRSFTYDGRGRRKTDTYAGTTRTFNWDAESRLVGLTNPGLSTSYGYNGLDARTSRTVGANTTTYKRAGAYVTEPVLNETTGQFSANYTPGVSERRAGVSTFLHSGLKNADARTTDGSAVTADRQYDAFGNLTGGNGTWNGPFGYAGGFGYQEDGESGLKLLGHRFYDSTTGRFLSKDPASRGRNWYAYCGNNPLNGSDPRGLDKVVIVRGNQTDPFDISKITDDIVSDYKREAEARGDTVIVVKSVEDALKEVVDADALVLVGHHDPVMEGEWDPLYAGIYVEDGGLLDPHDISRARRGKRLKYVHLVACNSLTNEASAAAWARICDGNLHGYYNLIALNYYAWGMIGLNKYTSGGSKKRKTWNGGRKKWGY